MSSGEITGKLYYKQRRKCARDIKRVRAAAVWRETDAVTGVERRFRHSHGNWRLTLLAAAISWADRISSGAEDTGGGLDGSEEERARGAVKVSLVTRPTCSRLPRQRTASPVQVNRDVFRAQTRVTGPNFLRNVSVLWVNFSAEQQTNSFKMFSVTAPVQVTFNPPLVSTDTAQSVDDLTCAAWFKHGEYSVRGAIQSSWWIIPTTSEARVCLRCQRTDSRNHR